MNSGRFCLLAQSNRAQFLACFTEVPQMIEGLSVDHILAKDSGD
jgi:hypothetical protein